ncbi:hypothetical protein KR215_003824 [Drosophila sulfurigaster]|nr:hypothetical protein KR215_003824 [Drosophila sulfurigaster]
MDLNHSTYTMEFFNFTPEQISAERDHLVKSLIKRAVDLTVKKIESPATSEVLAQQKDTVMRLMQEGCQSKLDQLGEMDKQIFNVPPHVLLIKDFELEKQFSSEEEEARAARLEELKERYRENMATLAELHAEEEKYAALQPHIERELEMHQRLYDACDYPGFKNIYEFANHLFGDADFQ